MSRRLNYTNRQKIMRDDVSIRLSKIDGEGIKFDAEFSLDKYKLNGIEPSPDIFIEAYRGASALWKRFCYGSVGRVEVPVDRSLNDFGVPDGILFRIKVTAADGSAAGRLIAEADSIRPLMPGQLEASALPLIRHMPADSIGDELWRVDFSDDLPMLLINSRLPIGVEQFLLDPVCRAIFATGVMRQVLTRILIIEQNVGDDSDPDDWRQRWLRFGEGMAGIEHKEIGGDLQMIDVEEWIDYAVEGFSKHSKFMSVFKLPEDKS